MSKKNLAILAIIVSALIWATAGVSAKTLLHDLSPFTIGFWRFLFATVCIIPLYLKEKHKDITLNQLLIPSFIGALNVPFYYLGIKTTTANAATLIYTAGPLVTAVLSYILIKEKNSVSKWVGIIIGLIGVLAIIMLPTFRTVQQNGSFTGNLLVVCGMLSWTVYTILLRRFRASNQISPITTTTVYFFVSTLVSLFLVLINHQPMAPHIVFSFPVLPVLLYTAICVTFLTYFMYQWALAYLSVTTASFKQYIETIAAIGLNIALLNESITLEFFIGSFLVLVGLGVITLGSLRSHHRR